MSDTTSDGDTPVVPTPPAEPVAAPAPPAAEPAAEPAPPAAEAPPAPAPPAYEPPAAPAAPVYEAPPAPAYEPPPAPAYGVPAAPAYDAAPTYPPAAYGAAPVYGTPPAPAYGAYAPVQPKTNTLAIVSLISAIVGIFVIPFIGSVVAVITGHMSLSQIKRTGERGHGMGLAGTIVGWVGIALSIIGLIIVIAWISWFTANAPYMRMNVFQ